MRTKERARAWSKRKACAERTVPMSASIFSPGRGCEKARQLLCDGAYNRLTFLHCEDLPRAGMSLSQRRRGVYNDDGDEWDDIDNVEVSCISPSLWLLMAPVFQSLCHPAQICTTCISVISHTRGALCSFCVCAIQRLMTIWEPRNKRVGLRVTRANIWQAQCGAECTRGATTM